MTAPGGAVSAVHSPAAALAQPAQLLDVDMDQLIGRLAYVAPSWFTGDAVNVGEPVQTTPSQDRVHGRGGHVQQSGQPARAAFEPSP